MENSLRNCRVKHLQEASWFGYVICSPSTILVVRINSFLKMCLVFMVSFFTFAVAMFSVLQLSLKVVISFFIHKQNLVVQTDCYIPELGEEMSILHCTSDVQVKYGLWGTLSIPFLDNRSPMLTAKSTRKQQYLYAMKKSFKKPSHINGQRKVERNFW